MYKFLSQIGIILLASVCVFNIPAESGINKKNFKSKTVNELIDLLGDDDGVTVVPLAQADKVLDASLKRMANEADILNKLATGENASSSFPNPEIEFMS